MLKENAKERDEFAKRWIKDKEKNKESRCIMVKEKLENVKQRWTMDKEKIK